ncbi:MULTISPECIES: cold shock domain-containing protein [unclassified Pseudomonas]|uniref:cold shock domain-containing protein n=1 Tax=unclassified Pseudomonas TaxID=196821 RepID=UPI0025808C45|nr:MULTISPECIES: cold shock domain-containing protein [unclassified Pseudomonas]
MSDVKVAKVKLYNAKLKAGFLAYEVEEEEVILTSEAVGKLNLKNGDEVTFEVLQKDGRYYATNVKAK